jgi:hypothetical protein
MGKFNGDAGAGIAALRHKSLGRLIDLARRSQLVTPNKQQQKMVSA